jgi:hypothetical protein
MIVVLSAQIRPALAARTGRFARQGMRPAEAG